MSVLQFVRDQVENVSATVGQQKQMTENVMSTIQSYVPKVQAAWIGGDADEFAADVMRKLIPALMQLIAAIAGINTNLAKGTDIMNQADSKVGGMASQLGDMFSQI